MSVCLTPGGICNRVVCESEFVGEQTGDGTQKYAPDNSSMAKCGRTREDRWQALTGNGKHMVKMCFERGSDISTSVEHVSVNR